MNILAFDTALAACTVGVWRDGAICASERQLMDRGQAEHLVPMIAAVMGRAELSFDALSRIVVTVGPGSFTGVRVGLATARGLALAHGLPVIGLTTGQVLAAGAKIAEGTFVSIIDSKRGDLYVECFGPDAKPSGAALVLPPGELIAWLTRHKAQPPWFLAGDGIGLIGTGVSEFSPLPSVVFPDPAVMAALASVAEPGPQPVPLYVRPPDVTLPS